MNNPNDIVCQKCKQIYKTYEGNFSKAKDSRSGYKYRCKLCYAEATREYLAEKNTRIINEVFMKDKYNWIGSKERQAYIEYKQIESIIN